MTPRPPANQLNVGSSAAVMAWLKAGGGKFRVPPPAGLPHVVHHSQKQGGFSEKKRPARKAKVARTRNGGTITESAYWYLVRSALRRGFRFWKPALACLKASRVAYSGPRGRKWAYLCAGCQRLFVRTDVQIDHKVPVGSLKCLADLPGFLERLTPERPEDFACLCLDCHATKTAAEREAKP